MVGSTDMITKVCKTLDSTPGADKLGVGMLLKALPHLFGGSPHKYQLEVTNMLRSTLKTAHDAEEGEVTAATAKVEELKAKLESLKDEYLEAEKREKEANEANEQKAVALAEKKKVTKEEEERHSETTTVKVDAEQRKQEFEKQKSEVDSVANGSMQMLLQGSWQDEEARDDFVRAVCQYMQTMGCDKVLLAALPKSLGCCPDERGAFSKAAVEESTRLLSEKSVKVASSLAVCVETLEEKKAEDLGAWAIADLARDNEKQALQEKTDAENTLHMRIVEGKLAKDKVQEVEKEFNQAASKRALIEAKVKDIDMALVEIVNLESQGDDANKENEGSIEPAAKRMKLGHGDTELPSEVPLASP